MTPSSIAVTNKTPAWCGVMALLVVMWVLSLAAHSDGPSAQYSHPPTRQFRPVLPKVKQVQVNRTDPHVCTKPDDAQFQGTQNTLVAATARQFHDPGFLFDTK